MGLDIISKSDIEYSAGYSRLHGIRFLAYKAQGGSKSFDQFYTVQSQSQDPDWPYALCLLFYPNLMWHSDCNGTYTLRGKPDFEKGELLTGNSKRLLWELNDIKHMIDEDNLAVAEEYPMDYEQLEVLRSLVEDVVLNHDGRIQFA